jgi:hypothetical protein
MPGFEELRAGLAALTADRERNRNQLLLARESVKRDKREAQDRLIELEQEAARLDERRDGVWDQFVAFSDPREALQRMSDRTPILMFPLRIETRFKQTARGVPQLWVRVYPDQCLAESFEESLTEQEAKNAENFWAAIWRAGGVDADESTAWRELASAHGAGRAGWIVKHHTPVNTADQPPRAKPGDVLLIATAPEPAPAPAAVFWEKVWRAGGTAAALAAERVTLEANVGAALAQRIVEKFMPVNLGQAPAAGETRVSTSIVYAVAQFTPLANLDLRRNSWSRAPRVRLLPERLVFTAWSETGDPIEHIGAPILAPLAAGPDPNASGDEQLRPDGDDLKIPDSIAWMFDFERALSVGMAFRIDLTTAQARDGFKRIVVMGVRVSDTAAEGRKGLESLIENHLYSRTGFELLPQGTATNNTEADSTGFQVHGDPDAAFESAFRDQPLFTTQTDPLLRSDGEWFSRLLGISRSLAQRLPNADGRDQIDVRAMHLALWPGTIGYMMRTMLAPVFSEEDADATRSFFTRHISGRGSIPALRIGAQPYGVLPVTSFRDVQWFAPRHGVGDVAFRATKEIPFLRRLYALVLSVESDWDRLQPLASYVGKPEADPHQVLLDVLGLHPSSVEFHSLKADSRTHMFHVLSLLSYPVAIGFLRAVATKDDALALLRKVGYVGATEPDALEKVFSTATRPLTGPLIDTVPLSETEAVSACAGTKNYLEWLAAGARSNFDIIQEQRGFDAGREPSALLFLMLRHALQIAFSQTGQREKVREGVMNAELVSYAEPAFVHVQAANRTSESRYGVLYETLANRRIADAISSNIDRIDPELSEQIAAIELLARRPTAALERAFAEHTDCASYRLDAWKQGLISWQLERLRASEQQDGGTFLGAYGWLEEVKPENKTFTPVTLALDVDALVNKPGDVPLMRESTNLGLIHAPSLNHATTAAVLRNGYHANEGRMAVDLSSRRVRLAGGIVEGMRAGQSLGALLGYRFERHLHDSNVLGLRAFVFAIRRQFPLAANQIKSTVDTSLTPEQAEVIAAKNVVDGRKLLAFVDASATKTYPWGLNAVLPPITVAAEGTVIDAAVAHLRDVSDAVADLALAEGVHQAVIGNFDRSAGTLEAFAKGGLPPEADVIRTPRTGTSLTLRTALHLDPAVTANPLVGVPMTVMANAEPVLNAWLGARLPPADSVGCSVTFIDRVTNNPKTIFVLQRDIALQPLDLILVTHAASDPSLGFLDDRVLQFVHATQAPRLDAPIRIEYTKRVTGKVTFFELRALLDSLYALTIASRPLKPADLIRQVDARGAEQPPIVLDTARLTAAQTALNGPSMVALQTLLAALPAGTIDDAIAGYVAGVAKLALWRLPQTGIGFTFDFRWDGVLTTAKQKLAAFDGAPARPEVERRAALAEIELLISVAYITPQPATVALYRTRVSTKVADFEAEITTLKGYADSRFSTFSAFLSALQGEALDAFEREALKLSEDVAEITRFRDQLAATLTGLIAEARKRATEAGALLAKIPLSIDIAQQAAKKLLARISSWFPHSRCAVRLRPMRMRHSTIRQAASWIISRARSDASSRSTTGCMASRVCARRCGTGRIPSCCARPSARRRRRSRRCSCRSRRVTRGARSRFRRRPRTPSVPSSATNFSTTRVSRRASMPRSRWRDSWSTNGTR